MRSDLVTEHARSQREGLLQTIERHCDPERARWVRAVATQGRQGINQPAVLHAMVLELTAALAAIIDLQAQRIDELEAVVGKKRAA